jgi:deoxyribodipyrimidine photo-lyase
MSIEKKIIIHWFRQDLRIYDNPSLFEAAKQGSVLPIYILDDDNSGPYQMGEASRWWLHHSLKSLNKSLEGNLKVYNGDPKKILLDLSNENDIKGVFWNRCYEPWRILRDKEIKKLLGVQNIKTKSFNGSLLWEPWNTLKKDGTPYRVFTPFYRKGCLNAESPKKPLAKPKVLKVHVDHLNGTSIDNLKLLPTISWHKKLEPYWKIGELSARKTLEDFKGARLNNYKNDRDYPALSGVSRLSPHLHFGEISPNQIWYDIKIKEETNDINHFLRELGWREFSHNLLYHFPELPRNNLQKKFDKFPWLENADYLQSWQTGQTGYPLVDAGMRELWKTGYMHNRLRMVVASFLVKNLLLHWHHGERWFWNCLLDADLANNSASWQWVAGCGADAAPYFRIFNPCIQGQKFDPNGDYTKQFVPELKSLPNEYLFNPWEAPDAVLQKAGIILGKNYPKPIINLKLSRLRALDAFKSIK